MCWTGSITLIVSSPPVIPIYNTTLPNGSVVLYSNQFSVLIKQKRDIRHNETQNENSHHNYYQYPVFFSHIFTPLENLKPLFYSINFKNKNIGGRFSNGASGISLKEASLRGNMILFVIGKFRLPHLRDISLRNP